MGTRKTFYDLQNAIRVWQRLQEEIEREANLDVDMNIDEFNAMISVEQEAMANIGEMYLIHRGLLEGAGQ